MALLQSRGEQLANQQAQWQDKLEHIYGKEDFAPSEDPEQQLYDGFIGDRDRRLCEQVRALDPAQLAKGTGCSMTAFAGAVVPLSGA
jgi:exodeoxyribonuclease-1